jgi:hypothetical protein
MRIGEALKLTPPDVDEPKPALSDPKSGKRQKLIPIELVNKIILRTFQGPDFIRADARNL